MPLPKYLTPYYFLLSNRLPYSPDKTHKRIFSSNASALFITTASFIISTTHTNISGTVPFPLTSAHVQLAYLIFLPTAFLRQFPHNFNHITRFYIARVNHNILAQSAKPRTPLTQLSPFCNSCHPSFAYLTSAGQFQFHRTLIFNFGFGHNQPPIRN